MKNKYPIALLLFVFGTVVQAQQTTIATGGIATGSGGNISYSVGQTVYTAYLGIDGAVSYGGVQQPYEITTELAVPKFKDIILQLQAFPNPTIDFLMLVVGDIKLANLSFQLFDLNGKLIQSKKITSNTETISTIDLPVAVYSLKVMHNNEAVKTFKIIKKI